MKKQYRMILLIAVSILAISGCSSPSTTTNQPVSNSPETETIIVPLTEEIAPEDMPIILEDSEQWLIDPHSFQEYCQTEADLNYYNNYIFHLKPNWSDEKYIYRDLQGSNEIGIFITYWDSAPFNVYDDQAKTSVLCNVHGINFRGIYQCKETAYIYGYVKTTSDDYYDPFDFEGYGWVDPRELEDGYMISY